MRVAVIAGAARGKAIRELLAKARAEEAPALAAPPPEPELDASAPAPRRQYRERRADGKDGHGRPQYLARASCCGREGTKLRNVLERSGSACISCTPRRGAGQKQTCRSCGEKGHNAGTCKRRLHADPVSASTFLRCKLSVAIQISTANTQAQAFTKCGALVLGKKLHQHLVDVHGLEVAVDEVGHHFDQVDPRQGAEK